MQHEIRAAHSPVRYAPSEVTECHCERSRSPARNIVYREHCKSPARSTIHVAPPIVENVFEKSEVIGAVASEEQVLKYNELKKEAETMRVHMSDYSNLVDQLRALQSNYSLLTEENMLRKSEFATRGDAGTGLVSSLK